MVDLDTLREFVRESNRIEGLTYEPTERELDASGHFLRLKDPKPGDMESLVWQLEPGAALRTRPGMDVRVGNHRPPPGHPGIRGYLENLMSAARYNRGHPYIIHCRYETLHPFMDGNGRSGRLLWAWQMLSHGYRPGLRLGFLHCWYYQSLEHAEERRRACGQEPSR